MMNQENEIYKILKERYSLKECEIIGLNFSNKNRKMIVKCSDDNKNFTLYVVYEIKNKKNSEINIVNVSTNYYSVLRELFKE